MAGIGSNVMWFGDALNNTPFEHLVEPLRAAFTSDSVAVSVQADVRELPPEPGDTWVKREFTGRKAIVIEWEGSSYC